MELAINEFAGPRGNALPVEIVERKGLGHPDSISDALAERLSLALCRHYRERFRQILHHNVDKVLLRGGAAAPAFGGGRLLQPIDVYLSGRATESVGDERIPIEQIAVASTRAWFREMLPEFDTERDLRVHCLVRPGSADLTELYGRQRQTGRWLANDTSIGVGFAPLSRLESVVLQLERCLNALMTRARFPMLGRDIKIMGVRHGEHIRLTVAAAFVGRHLTDLAAYAAAKTAVAGHGAAIATDLAGVPVEVELNTADDLAAGSVYLTVSGTSAEAGDDGQAGRGNRVNGLITPFRPMTMESVAGKNPVTHVGKVYNVVAGLIANALVQELPEVLDAECWLVSRIGQPVNDPAIVEVRLRLDEDAALAKVKPAAAAVVRAELQRLADITDGLVAGEIAMDRWPLGPPGLNVGPFGVERERLLAAIAAEARETADYTGRPAFAPAVLRAMASVPRQQFVPERLRRDAYEDEPLPIGSGQTISQPYIVALMTDLLDPTPEDLVLEIGTGSGYQAAVLSLLVRQVYGIEVVDELATAAARRLRRLGYANVVVRSGDGNAGWPERAPFDGIIVTAAAPAVPPALVAQLKPGGRLVIPVGEPGGMQRLLRLVKDEAGQVHQQQVLPVAFVPLIGRGHARQP
jgi:S-adenosylmethionine synthetase